MNYIIPWIALIIFTVSIVMTVRLYRRNKKSTMTEQDKELVELADILLHVIEANKGVPEDQDGKNLDAEGLGIKFFNHLLSVVYLSRGINIEEVSIPITNYPDHTSVDVLVRSAYEACLVFHHIFLGADSDAERDFRFLCWSIAGLYEKQSFAAVSEEDRQRQTEEKVIIEELLLRIKNNDIFNAMQIKKRTNLMRNFKRGHWRQISWTDMAQNVGFSELNSRTIYILLSDRAHSGNLSVKQIWQAKDHITRKQLMKSSLGHLQICTAMMIKNYCEYSTISKEYFVTNYEEPNIVTLYVGVGIEESIESIFGI